FQSELSKNVPSHEAKVAQIGRYFAAGADRREATKFGILLLEVSGSRTDSSLLETLALNDEFTLFAALALAHVTDDPARAIWDIFFVCQKFSNFSRMMKVGNCAFQRDGRANSEGKFVISAVKSSIAMCGGRRSQSG